jgi:hypothetical protein
MLVFATAHGTQITECFPDVVLEELVQPLLDRLGRELPPLPQSLPPLSGSVSSTSDGGGDGRGGAGAAAVAPPAAALEAAAPVAAWRPLELSATAEATLLHQVGQKEQNKP